MVSKLSALFIFNLALFRGILKTDLEKFPWVEVEIRKESVVASAVLFPFVEMETAKQRLVIRAGLEKLGDRDINGVQSINNVCINENVELIGGKRKGFKCRKKIKAKYCELQLRSGMQRMELTEIQLFGSGMHIYNIALRDSNWFILKIDKNKIHL